MTTQQRNNIEKEMQGFESGRFQEFLLKFLPLYDKRYEGIRRNGHNEEGKTCKGIPDLIKTDERGKQIACECGTEKDYWEKTNKKGALNATSKPFLDLNNCLTKLVNISEIILASNRPIPPTGSNIESHLISCGRKKDCKVKILACQHIALWLESNLSKNDTLELVEEYFPGITKIQRLSAENMSLAEQQISHSELLAFTIGGDNFCYLEISSYRGKDEILIHNVGKYPLYNISARIVKLHNPKQIKDIGISQVFKIPDMPPETCCSTGTSLINLGEGEERKFNIFWTTRNGHFQQQLRLKKTSTGWSQALRVAKYTGEILYERIAPDFPRDEQGLVNWE